MLCSKVCAVPAIDALIGRQRGNILATNAGDEVFRDALQALETVENTGRNGGVYVVPGNPIPLSRR